MDVRLDNRPNAFELRSRPSFHHSASTVQFRTGRWYKIRCRLDEDGTFTAWLDEENKLTQKWEGAFPVVLSLHCQRSGARYRNIVIQELP